MQTLPTSELGFKYWLKVLAAFAIFIAPTIFFAAVFDYAGILGNFIGDPTFCKGAAVDYHCSFGGTGYIEYVQDFDYDKARDASRIITAITFLITTFLTFKFVFQNGSSKLTVNVILRGLALQYSFPILVHLIGTFAINNYGGIGGGL